ncbi:MAG: DUF2807 domain-containing protein [Balneola sp.]|nr:DUF2807 domain-containing protein [Balneola sp.]MBO6650305.1 DUF2807 domain-containing protein [Balneola sp.]MBO6712109.1 DUF2807 domain-containing protein [Balneola sp.]MBO6800303.1 DUF2807 domain-containing protein [Balneola sp.]MBO6869683.1 DUF2807 domain-containing protein [Balneola sp.]
MKILILSLLSLLVPLAPTTDITPNDWVTKQISVEPFSDLSIESAGNIVVLYSEKNTLQINGEGPCVDTFKATVIDNRLHLSKLEGYDNCKAEVVIGAPKIVDISVKNGGIINLSSVKADSMFASIEDGGVISLEAEEFLYGKIRGGGVINYKGNPFVYKHIIDFGEVKRN